MTEQLIPPRLGGSSKQERHQFWQEVIDLHKKSNLTRREFCTTYGLKRSDFSRWHFRLNRKENSAKNSQKVVSSKQVINQPDFIEFCSSEIKSTHQSKSNQPNNDNEHFILKLKSGAQLMIPNEFNQQTLAKIILSLGVTL